jgi:penicillin-binding protein 1A
VISHRDRVIDAITAYQVTSMLQGVVTRGTAASAINLPVPVAGKTGTTNEAKDVWFVGFTSNIVAGCYIGFDQPKTLGGSAFGGTLCAPIFQTFMSKAVKKYGGGDFPLPPGGHFIKIDRYTGARLSDDAYGDNVVAEYFRDGEEPVFGITLDGGFAMGVNLPLFEPGQSDEGTQVRTSDGGVGVITDKANASTLGTGGLY